MCLVREESRLPFELFPAVSVRELQRKKQNIREILERSQPHPHADCIGTVPCLYTATMKLSATPARGLHHPALKGVYEQYQLSATPARGLHLASADVGAVAALLSATPARGLHRNCMKINWTVRLLSATPARGLHRHNATKMAVYTDFMYTI